MLDPIYRWRVGQEEGGEGGWGEKGGGGEEKRTPS